MNIWRKGWLGWLWGIIRGRTYCSVCGMRLHRATEEPAWFKRRYCILDDPETLAAAAAWWDAQAGDKEEHGE